MTNRRDFLQTLPAAALSASSFLAACRPRPSLRGSSDLSRHGISGRYDEAAAGAYLSDLRVETRLAGTENFTEGPAADRTGSVYFTNIPASQILKWDPSSGELSVFRENSRKANGLLFDEAGRLLVCEGGTGRVVRVDVETSSTEILADTYQGHPLESPNDLTLDAEGRVYFSSRPSGEVPERQNVYVKAVYRIDPDGSVHQLLREPQVDMPNGLVVSADETKLYLIEAHGGEGRSRHIKAFDLASDGTISNEEILIDFYPGRSGDGMCIDEDGNLYVAAGLHARRGTSETLDTRPGIHVVSPGGELLDYFRTPEDTVTNCTFGGDDLRTLYITAGSLLLSARSTIPGHKRYRPRQ